MGHGGKRPGSGRKPGSRTQKTREIAERAAAEGLEPLEVMLKAMRLLVDEGKWSEASTIAKDAAPYCHPRLSAVEVAGKDGGPINWAATTAEEIEDALYAEYRGLGIPDAKARALAHASTGEGAGGDAGAVGGKPH